ncbi:MAG: hypothetical protein PUD50_02145 [Eubacteriales bacterium]|nr:hypothetical protein [Eubacteriales bacterium]
MSKYHRLWKYVQESGRESLKLTFAEIESILGMPIDHSFLNDKKELTAYGYRAGKISMKERTIVFEKMIESMDEKAAYTDGKEKTE